MKSELELQIDLGLAYSELERAKDIIKELWPLREKNEELKKLLLLVLDNYKKEPNLVLPDYWHYTVGYIQGALGLADNENIKQ